jgi:hypothetical protein
MFETRATFHPPMFWLNGSASKNICHTQIAKRKKKGKKKARGREKKNGLELGWCPDPTRTRAPRAQT